MNTALTDFNERPPEPPTNTADQSQSTSWPDILPEPLQLDHLPPVRSTDPLTETGPASQIHVGDVDCYQTDEVGPFGFLITHRSSSGEVGIYCLHTGFYSTFDLEAFEDIPPACETDKNGNLKIDSKRKIYTGVANHSYTEMRTE